MSCRVANRGRGSERDERSSAFLTGSRAEASASASLGGIDAIKAGFDVSPDGVHHVSGPYAYREADGAGPEAYCDRLVEEFADLVERVGAERIACFIAEPVMGMGGVLIPPPGYFRRISEICKANDILIVADEAVTGFGRLGEFLASDAVTGSVGVSATPPVRRPLAHPASRGILAYPTCIRAGVLPLQ